MTVVFVAFVVECSIRIVGTVRPSVASSSAGASRPYPFERSISCEPCVAHIECPVCGSSSVGSAVVPASGIRSSSVGEVWCALSAVAGSVMSVSSSGGVIALSDLTVLMLPLPGSDRPVTLSSVIVSAPALAECVSVVWL